MKIGATGTTFVTAVVLFAVACIASGDAGRLDGVGPRAGAEWKLPAKEFDMIGGLAGSADGRVICFAVISSPRERRAGGGPQVACWMLETATGKLTDLGKLLSEKVKRQGLRWHKAAPSPDGKHILVLAQVTGGRPKMAVYLLTLQSGAVRKVAEGMPVFAAWSKDKVYVSSAGEDQKFGSVSVYDPTTAKSTESKVCGMVAAVEPAGGFLVCVCDPDDPTKPLPLRGLSTAWCCIVSPEGRVQAKLVSSDEMSRPPMLSPGGKYLAFERQKSYGRQRPPEILGTRIVSSDGKTQRDIKAGAPVAVTDTGELVAAVQDRPGGSAAIKFIDLAGKSVTLAPKANAAIVCGDLLFYVPSGTAAKLKTVALKKPKPVVK